MNLLAGPIVRRIEDRCIAVWVAVDEACTVGLDVWPELQKHQGASSGAFQCATPIAYTGSASTIQIGAKLHLALVRADFSGKAALLPGQLYSYNVRLGASDDLRTLGLLKDGPLAGPLGNRPHLALGYDADALPGFATVPELLEDLVIVHGSCRNPVGPARDALGALDSIIGGAHHEGRGAKSRPHQLFLTGDQIYADEALDCLLGALDDTAANWIGDDTVPVGGANWPVDKPTLPGGRRRWLLTSEARFSSTDTAGQIVSFGEFAAMYLFSFAEVLWPDAPPDPLVPTKNFDRLLGPSDWSLVHAAFDPNGTASQAVLELFAQLEKTPSDDAENAARPDVYAKLAAAAGEPAIAAAVKTAFTAQPILDRQKKLQAMLARYRRSLAHVRRALANVATYLITDDHEVTDDWNLSRDWQERVLARPLGCAVIRNALTAYGLFQAWGNDPAAWDDPASPGAQLLAAAKQFYSGGAGPSAPAIATLDKLFGLAPPAGQLANPIIRWDFQVPGQRHHVRVLDTRTHRAYRSRWSPPALLDAKAFDDQIGRADDPVGPLPPGKDVLVVISPAPVVNPAIVDELLQPALTAYGDIHAHLATRYNESGEEQMDVESWPYDPDALETLLARLAPAKRVVLLSGDIHFSLSLDLLYWRANAPAARFVQFVSSATSNEQPLIGVVDRSSAAGQWMFAQALMPVERLGFKWQAGDPDPIVLPSGAAVPPIYVARLGRDNVLLPTIGWPSGTTLRKTPDWSWRLAALADTRHDDDSHPDKRPVEAWPLKLPSNADHPTIDLDLYAQVAALHAQSIDTVAPRGTVWASNISVVRFERQPDGIYVRQELTYLLRRAKGSDTSAASLDDQMKPYQAFTVHRTKLELPSPSDALPQVKS